MPKADGFPNYTSLKSILTQRSMVYGEDVDIELSSGRRTNFYCNGKATIFGR